MRITWHTAFQLSEGQSESFETDPMASPTGESEAIGQNQRDNDEKGGRKRTRSNWMEEKVVMQRVLPRKRLERMLFMAPFLLLEPKFGSLTPSCGKKWFAAGPQLRYDISSNVTQAPAAISHPGKSSGSLKCPEEVHAETNYQPS